MSDLQFYVPPAKNVCRWCEEEFTGHFEGNHDARFCSEACRLARYRATQRVSAWAGA